MLGRFTFLFDHAHRIPVLGSSRIPVRFHLWVSLAVAALAAVGVDRLARPGRGPAPGGASASSAALVVGLDPDPDLRLRPGLDRAAALDRARITSTRFRWLGRELAIAVGRTAVAGPASAWRVAIAAAGDDPAPAPARLAGASCRSLVIADLLGVALRATCRRSTPRTGPTRPRRPALLKADPAFDPGLRRSPSKSAGEPGYASRAGRLPRGPRPLAWSLPPVWGLRPRPGRDADHPAAAARLTPTTPGPAAGRFDVEGVTHLVTGRPHRRLPGPSPSRPARPASTGTPTPCPGPG